jgi:hypothetical protein
VVPVRWDGHCIIVECDHFDLHCDGTSRGGKKYVGQQVTTEAVSLSAGFTAVASEDTTTLTEINQHSAFGRTVRAVSCGGNTG